MAIFNGAFPVLPGKLDAARSYHCGKFAHLSGEALGMPAPPELTRQRRSPCHGLQVA
jgi:hypothetical protein